MAVLPSKKVSSLKQKIASVEGIALSSPYGSGDSFGQPLGVKSIGIVRITLDSGEYGVGETYAGVYVPELISPICKTLESHFVGESIGDVDVVNRKGDIPFIGRSGMLKSVLSAIDIALWDLRGKLLSTPTSDLLSEIKRPTISVYASSGSVVLTPDQIAEECRILALMGFDYYKMRVGVQDWNIDVERVGSAHQVFGKNRVMVDAIMGTIRPTWTLREAIKKATDLSKFDLAWLEEPLHPDNVLELARLSKLNICPIAAGEAYSGSSEFAFIMNSRAVNVLQVDATHSGGMQLCVDLLRQASKAGLGSSLHVWGSAIAVSANIAVAAAAPDDTILEIPMVPLKVSRDMFLIDPTETLRNGVIDRPSLPGLGVVFNDELIAKYPFAPGSGYQLPKDGGAKC